MKVALLFCLIAAIWARVTFEGHKIVSIPIRSAADVSFLRSLPEVTDGVSGVDVINNDGQLVVGFDALVRLTPNGHLSLVASGIPHTITIDNLQKHMEEVQARPAYVAGQPIGIDDDFFHHFQRYDAMASKLSTMANNNPTFTKLFPSIGRSIEGRDIAGIRIGKGGAKSNITLILGGIHAREWIAHGVAMWVAESFIEDYNNKVADVVKMLDNQEVYIVPCYNPDGYEYAQTTNRQWRKNRRHNSGGSYGVDLNRNWDAQWGEYGSSTIQTSDTYCGTAPFSEPETKAVSTWILDTLGGKSRVVTMVDLHSNAELVLRPYGWTTKDCPDEKYLKTVGDNIVSAIKAVHGTKYVSEKGSQLYPAGGCTDNWHYDVAGVVRSFTFELAGSSFVVPDSDIQKQGEEIYAAFKYLASLAI